MPAPDIHHSLEDLSPQVMACLQLQPPLRWSMEEIRENPYSYTARVRVTSAEVTHPLFLKIFKDASGALDPRPASESAGKCYRQLTALSRHLTASSGFAVPRPVAHAADMILMEMAPGIALDGLRTGGGRKRLEAFAAAGEWLFRFRSIPVEESCDAVELFEKEVIHVRRVLGECRDLHAFTFREHDHGVGFLDRLAGRIRRTVAKEPLVLCHNDYIPMNVFWAPGCLTAIDIGGVRPGFWPRDIASMLFDLTIWRITSFTGWRGAKACEDAFLRGCNLSGEARGGDLFTFYHLREFAGRLRNLVHSRPGSGAGRYKSLIVARAVKGRLLRLWRENAEGKA